ncbi:progonadoliberin-1-like [Pristis pectinata]|uniref:progonadoliberin-1-like n=1 Tax=Pristis pectinata TaxID=685728 RepID=UPI00223CA07B|nr:progonadoliberin-1-like [Pristis pectinata]
MLASKKALVCLVMAATLIDLHSAQHWSFNMRPGGKREAAGDVVDPFQDTTGNMESVLQDERKEFLFPDCSSSMMAKFIPGRKKLQSECRQVTRH